VAAAFFCAAATGAPRDWAKYPAVTQIAKPEEIFAIGDAHSDFNRLARAMVAARIIEAQPANPEDAHWRAGHAVLMLLRTETRRAGGDVVILAGNHEAEFLADPTAVGACKGEIGEFRCSLSFGRVWATGSFRMAATRVGAPSSS
jgi:hypothetical protein